MQHSTEDLERLLDGCEPETLVMTGTFDPSHCGHVDALRTGFATVSGSKKALVIPHNWNERKTPHGSIPDRARWLGVNIRHFAPEIAPQTTVVSCEDLVGRESLEKFDELLARNRGKVVRLIGDVGRGGMMRSLERDHIRYLLAEHTVSISSTMVRAAIAAEELTGLESWVATPVFEEIISSCTYKPRS